MDTFFALKDSVMRDIEAMRQKDVVFKVLGRSIIQQQVLIQIC